MKERPIIMTSESVQAILDNRKSQTRRVIKPQPKLVNGCDGQYLDWRTLLFKYKHTLELMPRYCPYGVPGDRLWVKEIWGVAPTFENIIIANKRADWILYKAEGGLFDRAQKWNTPLFMPRWASRINLEIVYVWAERLQNITDTNGMYEGWKCDPDNLDYLPRMWYADLWDRINAKRGYSWESNPFVWVIEFKQVQP